MSFVQAMYLVIGNAALPTYKKIICTLAFEEI